MLARSAPPLTRDDATFSVAMATTGPMKDGRRRVSLLMFPLHRLLRVIIQFVRVCHERDKER